MYLSIDSKYFDDQLNETIKLLKTNNIDIHLNIDITEKSNIQDYLKLNEYKDVISTLNFRNCSDLNLIYKDISCYTNLQRIKFLKVESDIILKEMPYLFSIHLFGCNRVIVSNCKHLKNIQIINVKNCDIDGENNHLNLLGLVSISNLGIEIDRINYFFFHSEIEKINLQINFVELFFVNYGFIKENAAILLKNILNINKITFSGCNVNNNEVKSLQNILNNVNLLRNINLLLNNDIFNAELVIKDKKQFMESSQFFLIENKEDCFIINNINNYNIQDFTIMSTQNRNVKMVNFDSLFDLKIETTNISLDITELISLRSLTVLQENIINYNHLNLSKLIIKNNKNLNIKLNNLSNLKELEILGCKGISLELENKRMKLQNITLEKLNNLNINLKLNCPELYKFYFSCYEIESDIINFEFCNTPLLFIPEIRILIENCQ